ncbi:hypothetical protein AI2716V1_0386 [Enterobacter cloacae]|nr:hypothetical protein AI2716V1_0386 [Enterobacter cloacae]CAH3342575.1 hypothetical protein AI2716V1_0386 [Enterobacter cloacae]
MNAVYDALFLILLVLIPGIFIGFGTALVTVCIGYTLYHFLKLILDVYKELKEKLNAN